LEEAELGRYIRVAGQESKMHQSKEAWNLPKASPTQKWTAEEVLSAERI